MSDTIKKITKRQQYNVLLNLVDYAEEHGAQLHDEDTEITFDTLRDFINHEIELLDSRAASAQKRAEEKREKGDILRENVYNVLSDDTYMTIDEIVTAVNDPDVTRNMVTSRLTQLIKLNRVVKDTISVDAGDGKSKKAVAYIKNVNIEA